MSMNFFEFKKLLGADPLNRDSETLRARSSSPEFEAAAKAAEAFEEKLQTALNVGAPSDLLADIKSISRQPVKRRRWVPLAMAASLLLAVGTAGIVWQQSHQWDSVEDYVADHYSHDGLKVLATVSDGVAEQDITRIMSKLGASAALTLSKRIKFIKFCPTPNGRGAHMVVSTDQGPITIIFMPKTDVTDGEMVNFDQQHALLVSLDSGSAAIIGTRAQAVEGLESMIRDSLKTKQLDA